MPFLKTSIARITRIFSTEEAEELTKQALQDEDEEEVVLDEDEDTETDLKPVTSDKKG